MRAWAPRTSGICACALLAACSGSDVRKPVVLEAIHAARKTTSCAGSAEIALLHHEANLSIALSPPMLSGEGEVRLQALAAASAIALDTPGLLVSEASVEGWPVKVSSDGEITCFELAQPLAAGDEATLSLSWQVDPYNMGVIFSADQAWSSYPASTWLPTKLDATQRATLKLGITAPEDVAVFVSNSKRSSTPRPRGVHRGWYEITTPTSPQFYAFAAGHFEQSTVPGPGYSLSAYGPHDVDLMAVLERTQPIYQFLRDWTGVSPLPYSYSQVFVHGEAQQAAVGLSLLSDRVAREVGVDPNADAIIGQQLVRQWFGVLVPCADPADLWLHDGFATFMLGAFHEHHWGSAAYERELASWRATHDRGALVLDKLRVELGDKIFWKGIRLYVANQAGKPTRSEDLRNALTAASGRDLTSLFEHWVSSPASDL